MDKESACNAGDTGDTGLIPESGRSPGGINGHPLQYSCWKIPRTEEPGGLQSKGSQRVKHDWATKHAVDLKCCVSFRCIKNWFSYTYISILFHYRLLQDTGFSSLYYTVGLCSLSILYVAMCTCQSQTSNLSPFPSLFGNHKFVFHICESISESSI